MTATSQAPSNVGVGLPSDAEASLLHGVRLRMLFASLREFILVSKLRFLLIAVLTCLFWIGLFFLFLEGLKFLRLTLDSLETYEQTVQYILGVFFFSLMVMLVFSTGILIYGALFSSPDAAFLLSQPVRDERIVLHKHQDALAMGSWAFLLLGSPLLIAVGVVSDAVWWYYAAAGVYVLSFAASPGAVGTILTLWIVYLAPQRRLAIVVCAGAVIALAGLWLAGRAPSLEFTPGWLQESLGKLSFSQHKLLPSWWLSEGLLAALQAGRSGAPASRASDAVMFLALLLGNGLLGTIVAAAVGKVVYRRAYSRLHGSSAQKPQPGGAWVDAVAARLLFPFPPAMQLLLLKDFRHFRRDPAQWSQTLIAVGLLGLYFFNLDSLQQDYSPKLYLQTIGFLNLAVIGLMLAIFTTRFIYPMVSLEGNRVWILRLAPISTQAILWSKYLFAAASSIPVCATLVGISDLMLGLDWRLAVVHQVASLLLCLGLSGAAVGLGAMMPDLRETSPAKIASGFGGTLNLVASAAYIAVVLLLTAAPLHLMLARNHVRILQNWSNPSAWAAAGMIAAVAVTAIVTVGVMRVGERAFETLETP